MGFIKPTQAHPIYVHENCVPQSNWRSMVDHLLSLCFRGGKLYKKERTKKTMLDSKPIKIEPAENPRDEPELNKIMQTMLDSTPVKIEPAENPRDELELNKMVKNDIVSVPNDTIKVPKRKLPYFDTPKKLERHTGYNFHLVHDKNAVRNNNSVSFFVFFFFSLIFFYLVLVSSVTLSTKCGYVT